MNKKIVIGKKIKKIEIVKGFIVITLMPLFFLFILAAMIFPVLNISTTIKMIIALCNFVICWIILIPMLGGTQRIEFSKTHVSYYYINGMWLQFKEVLRVLLGHEEKYNFNLPIDKMISVNLSYRMTFGGYGLRGYTIMLTFLMNDNTIVKFTPFDISGGGNHNNEYLQSLDLLEKSGVKINDKYGLRAILKLSDQEIMYHIEDMEAAKYD